MRPKVKSIRADLEKTVTRMQAEMVSLYTAVVLSCDKTGSYSRTLGFWNGCFI